MSGELDVVVRPLVDFIDREAVKRALHIRCIEISDVVDPDEGSDEGVVRVTVDAPESVVAEFWCSLAEAIESYAQGLPPTK